MARRFMKPLPELFFVSLPSVPHAVNDKHRIFTGKKVCPLLLNHICADIITGESDSFINVEKISDREAIAFLYSYYFKKFGIFAIIFLDSWKKKGDFSSFFIKMDDRNSENTDLRVPAGQGGRV